MSAPIELGPEDRLLWIVPNDGNPSDFFKFAEDLRKQLGDRVVLMTGPDPQMFVLRA